MGAPRLVRGTVAGVAVVAAMLLLPGPALALEQKLAPPEGSLGFGRAVDVDGDIAVVGSPSDDDSAGAVYVFRRTGDTWTRTARLTASDPIEEAALGISVAVDGDTIVVGAVKDAANLSEGVVYVFEATGAAERTEIAKLKASDAVSQHRFGRSLEIDGDTIVVGADGDEDDRGAVYTFARTGPAARTETAKLIVSDREVGDRLGQAVGIDGDTIVASAPGDAVGADEDQGSVYTFSRTGAPLRTETAKLTAADGQPGEFLGEAVAISGDTIVAGATGYESNRGAAYTFSRGGPSDRSETAKLLASDGQGEDFFGVSVDVDGQTIVVGVPNDDDDRGTVHSFLATGAALRTQTGTYTNPGRAPDDTFGNDVAISGDTLLVGAFRDDEAVPNQGSATIFFQPAPAPAPAPVLQPTQPPAVPAVAPPFPAKLEVLRARVLIRSRRLDVLAPITGRASGRVRVSFQAAGRTIRFFAPIDARNARVRISRRITRAQARRGTGIVTIAYPGDADTQPQTVRLRAASGRALLVAGRPRIDAAGRLLASGRLSRAARGVVRLQILFEPAGRPTVVHEFKARVVHGRYSFSRALPAALLAQIAGRRGALHSYTLFTGYLPARMRGEMASFQVLP